MKVYLESLGCKLNQSEIETLARRFAARGHQIVSTPKEAETCVFNSCTVTHAAAQKSRQAVRRLRRANPSAQIVATGCYAHVAPGELEADRILDNAAKERLVSLLMGQGPDPPRPLPMLPPGSLSQSRTRAFVKVQDGCDNHCTYCITRVARGPQRSVPRAQVLAEIRARVEAGYQEVVLTGVHLGGYGRDRGRPPTDDLWDLVEAVLSETDVRRLRLSSVEPWDLTPGDFDLWRDPRLCRHLHLPLQSGSDETLRRMGRRYSARDFAHLVQAARETIPDVAITTDLIVGFPGETAAQFAQSLAFVEAMAFARAHVFPYSARPGTPAADLPDQIPPREKKRRAARMRAVAHRSAAEYQAQFIGQTVQVLWESRRNGHWRGLTDNYLRIVTASDRHLAQTMTSARLTGRQGGSLRGTLL
jgi:threonylcarbamoyladenosine tRNA methylthiotransferase MtaB